VKIQVVSDLHFEFGSQHLLYQMKHCDSDILVIAGDLHTSRGIISALHQVYDAVQKHIILVPGNHEYYHSQKIHIDALLHEEFKNHQYIHVLNDAVWEYNNVVFLGSTGWWTMNAAKDAVKYMNDFTYINDLIPNNYGLDWGWKSYEFFNTNLKKYDKRVSGKNVVCISHNAPSLQSIGDEFKDDPLNPCFANCWQHFMLSYKPHVWIHGHVHGNKEYRFDDTLVVCNPFGYDGHSTNVLFDPHKIICLPDLDI